MHISKIDPMLQFGFFINNELQIFKRLVEAYFRLKRAVFPRYALSKPR